MKMFHRTQDFMSSLARCKKMSISSLISWTTYTFGVWFMCDLHIEKRFRIRFHDTMRWKRKNGHYFSVWIYKYHPRREIETLFELMMKEHPILEMQIKAKKDSTKIEREYQIIILMLIRYSYKLKLICPKL